MQKKVHTLLFFIILALAIFLRVYQINSLPPALNWDEVSLGYNAYSILQTGRDEWGNFMPLSFRAFGDYKLPLYIYFSTPFIALFDLDEFSIRLLSVVSGIGVVILVFFIIKTITKSIYLAYWTMFISAILPWLVTFSRIALEANLALFLTTASFYLFLQSHRNKIFLSLSVILLGLSAFSYNSSRILIIPFSLLGIIYLSRSIKRSMIILPFLLLLFFIGIAFFQALTVDSGARYKWITILDEGAISQINQLRGLSHLPPFLTELIYNKATYFVVQSSKNYLSYFDPNFLFKTGGPNFQFSVPGSGQIYQSLLPLIILGIWRIIKERKKWQIFILGWLLIAPLPGAITRDAPHPLRAIFLVIPLLFCAVLGIKWIKDKLPSKAFALSAFLVVILLTETFLFWQNYNGNYKEKYSWVWQYGYKQAIEFINVHQDEYERIVLTKKYGEPHEFALFYLKYDPKKYQTNKDLIRYKKSDWFWVDRFDNFEFINDWEIKDKVSGMKNTLLITAPGNFPTNSQVLETINFLDGAKAFEIVEIN